MCKNYFPKLKYKFSKKRFSNGFAFSTYGAILELSEIYFNVGMSELICIENIFAFTFILFSNLVK